MANPHAHASRRATDSPQAAELPAVAEKCAELWLARNHQAFECWNAYVDKNGLPLAAYRSF